MSNAQNRTEEYCLRLVNLSAADANRIVREISSPGIEMAKMKGTEHFVVVIPLSDTSDFEALGSLVQTINEEDYGIYASLVTDRDNDGIRVPAVIRKFWKKNGGQMDFSFVVIDED